VNAVPTEELQAPVAQTPISLEDKHKLLNKQTRIQVRKLNSFVNVLTWDVQSDWILEERGTVWNTSRSWVIPVVAAV